MKFKNKLTGIVEDVTNASIIPQYLSHSDVYEQVKEKGRGKAENRPKAEK